VRWQIVYIKQAQRDVKKVSAAGLREKALEIIQILSKNTFQITPPYEKLIGDLSGAYSRRINIQHRIVYQVMEKEKIVKIIRMWTHYE
jgi:toxin YoeB